MTCWRCSERKLSELRGPLVAMIFQEPMTAFDPVYTIGQQIGETLQRHKGMDARAARARAKELLDLVQVPRAETRLDAYPHELSGGLRQRAMIALALSCRPALLLADEPTTALDATVQIQILLLLRSLQRELGMAMIFVTHDLSVAAEIADDVAVMYAGRFVETGPVSRSAAPAAPSLHGGTDGVLGRRQAARRASQRHSGPAAGPGFDLAWLQFRAALRACERGLSRRIAARALDHPAACRALLHPSPFRHDIYNA